MMEKRSAAIRTLLRGQVAFDADLSPQSEHNREAAKTHGLKYDERKRAYTDAEGALVRDRFGQPY